MTRSLSKSLYKTRFMEWNKEDTRTIDSNELMAKRLEEFAEKQKNKKRQGFVAGLQADVVDPGQLQGEDGESQLTEEELLQANVIKAGEDAEAIRTRANAEADNIVSQAKANANRLLSEATNQAMREREQVLAQARKQGYDEGRMQADAEAQKLREQFAAKEKQLEAEYQMSIDELEPKFVDTITSIYEHIFHVELGAYREILVHLISDVMCKLEGEKTFLVHVCREDYPYVSAQKKVIASESTISAENIEIIEDIALSKNQCLIETNGGIFDCGLGIQLSELGKKLRLLSYEK
ncbi:MAG: FliH/SctL family protein [Lachnoclostridium sp.]|nr:FliH/SctL family protein [Lachnospira sp.]MCM1246819.1 FliH/SctL family protein [Lachnoclostridium sp.]MCM1535394.1 FliH/SctL family protein [Clostridium sp.]